MTRIRTRATGMALAVIAIGALVVVPAPARAAAECAQETIPIYDLDITVKIAKGTYHVGEKVVLEITVKRPAKHDPAGGGVEMDPPAQVPAEGVNVGAGIRVEDVFLYGYGAPTDADGKTKIGIKLKPYTPEGQASVDVFAWKRLLEIPCFVVEEQGYTHIENAFRVKK